MEGMGHPHRKGIDFNKNPFIVIWEVTRACELKCVHCRADAQVNPDPRELTYQEGLKLIDNQHPHTRDFSRECAGVFSFKN